MGHLDDVKETYLEHLQFSVSVTLVGFIASVLSLIHGFLPGMFSYSAGDAFIYLADKIKERRSSENSKYTDPEIFP